MPRNDVGVKFIADDFDPFEKIIRSADKLLEGLNKSIEKTTTSMSKLETLTRSMTKTQRLASNQFLRSTRGANSYGQAVKSLETNVSDLAIRSQSGVSAIGRFETAQGKASEAASLFARNLARADTRLRTMNQRVRSADLVQFGSAMTAAGRGASTLSDNLRRAATRIKEVGGSAMDAANKVTSLATSLGKKAATGLLAFGAAGALAVGSVTATASSFESAFVGVGKTVDGLVELGDDGFLQVTEAGEKFRDSLQELTETTLPTTFENAAKVAELGGQLGFVSAIDDIDEAQEALLAFTETIIGLEEATDLTAEAAAQDLSRFANLFQEDFEDSGQNIRNIGNTIVELGNRSATTESQIVAFATRVAGAGKTVGLTQADVLGISAAFSSIGINAEAGGTAVSKVLLEMQKAANATSEGFVDNTEAIDELGRKQRDMIGELRALEHNTGLSAEAVLAQQQAFVDAGGSIADFGEQLGDTRQRRLLGMIEDIQELETQTEQLKRTHGTPFSSNLLDKFLDITGTTRDEFQRLQKEDPDILFQKLIEGIADRGDEAGAALEDLGFNTSQLRQALLGMAQNTDLLADSMRVANEEFDDGSALADEVEKRYATFDSRLQRFKNTLRGAAADIGAIFLPSISNMLSGGGEIVGVFGDRVPEVIDAVTGKIGELTGLEIGEFDFVTTLNAGFDSLIALIEGFDMTPVQTAIDTISTDVLPTLFAWLDLVSENWDTFQDAIVGFGTAAGVIATVSAITSIGASILGLLNPIGLAVAGVVGLSVIWSTNIGGIQEKTAALVDSVTESLSGLMTAFETEGTEGVFDFLEIPESIQTGVDNLLNSMDAILAGLVDSVTESLSGLTTAFETEGTEGVFDFLEIPESIQTGVDNLLSSFDDLTIGTSVQEFFDNLSALFSGDSMDAILAGLGTVGEAVIGLGAAVLALGTVAVSTTLDQLQGLIDIGANLIGFFDGLLELDSEAITASLQGVADGFLSIATAPFENIAEAITGEDLDFVTPITNALTLAADAAMNFTWPTMTLPTLPEGLTEFVDSLLAPFEDIELPEAFGNLSDQITDLFSGESAKTISATASAIGKGVGSLVSALVELATPAVVSTVSSLGDAIITVVGAIAALAAISISTALEVITGIVEGVSALIGIVDSILDSDIIGATTQIDNFISAIGSIALAPIENAIELFTGEDADLGAAITEWVSGASMALVAFEWPMLELPSFDTLSMAVDLSLVSQQIPLFFEGILGDVSLGMPIFPDIGAKIDAILQGIKDKFTGFLTNIDIGVPETLIDIAAAIGLDIGTDEAKEEGEKVGAAISEGIAQGQVDNAQLATDAASDVSEQTWTEWATSWLADSPSLRTMALGKDVVDGFALGLQDTETISPALEALNTLVLAGFNALAEAITTTTNPALNAFISTVDNMNTTTLPNAIGLLNDELIPAKIDLAIVNDQASISVDRLSDSEARLGGEIQKVIPRLAEQIEALKDTKTVSDKLEKALKKLEERYKTLAAAIAEAKRAGSGVATGVTGNEPIGTPAAGSFQKGGQFVVPSSIPKIFQTPSGGMLAEVHPGELVTVVPDPQLSAPQPIRDRAISGASLQQDISNVTNNQSSQQSFNLNVTEVVSKDVRTSFGLMRSLAGA